MFVMINIEQIEKWLSKAKNIGVFEELSKIPDLFINPRNFWNNFDGLTNSQKWLQFFTFALVFTIILWWARFSETSFSYLGKALIAEIIVAISSIVIVFLGNVIIVEIDQQSQYEAAMSVSNILVVFHPVHIIHSLRIDRGNSMKWK